MSAGSLRARAAILLVALYPEAWRERYGEELGALVADDPPGPLGLLSLVRGALAAHVRPSRSVARRPAADRIRVSIGGVFACWIAVSVAGASFQKDTEEPAFAALAAHHHLLGACRDLILAGAALGCASLAVGGLPLLVAAIRQAARTRDRSLAGWLALPVLGLGGFAAVTALVALIAPADVQGSPTGPRLALLVPWAGSGLAFAAACALAPRGALRRMSASPSLLRNAARLAPALVAAMALVCAGLLGYALSLARLGPALSAQSGGPIWPTTGAALGAATALAAAATGLAAVAAVRARAARRLAS